MYTPAGKLETRTWPRKPNGTDPIVTRYDYYDDPGEPMTGELESITYEGDLGVTLPVTFTYDRLGRKKDVTDAVGTRTFAYNSALDVASGAARES